MRVVLLLIACAIGILIGPGCGSSESGKATVDPGAPAGDVRELAGTVTATRDGASRVLVVGDVVAAGELIETGGDGDVVIELRHNQVRWHLGPSQAKKPIDALAWTAAAPTAPVGLGDDRTAAAGRMAEREAADTAASAVGGGEADQTLDQQTERAGKPTADPRADVPRPTSDDDRKPEKRGDPTGKKRKKAEPTGDAPPEPEKERRGTSTDCDEVSCVIDPGGACCTRMKTSDQRAPSGGGASELPETLDAAAIKAAIAAIKPRLIACGEGHAGKRVKLRFQVAADGSAAMTVEGGEAGLDACLIEAGKRARFGRTQQGGGFSYPLAF